MDCRRGSVVPAHPSNRQRTCDAAATRGCVALVPICECHRANGCRAVGEGSGPPWLRAHRCQRVRAPNQEPVSSLHRRGVGANQGDQLALEVQSGTGCRAPPTSRSHVSGAPPGTLLQRVPLHRAAQLAGDSGLALPDQLNFRRRLLPQALRERIATWSQPVAGQQDKPKPMLGHPRCERRLRAPG